MFPSPPWCYSHPSMSKLVRQILLTRHTLFTRVTATGGDAYLIRPLWWLDPNDTEVHSAQGQAVIGDYIIAIPGSSETRDIYLPKGTWRDTHRQVELVGGQWYRNYRVTLGDLPTFLRV